MTETDNLHKNCSVNYPKKNYIWMKINKLIYVLSYFLCTLLEWAYFWYGIEKVHVHLTVYSLFYFLIKKGKFSKLKCTGLPFSLDYFCFLSICVLSCNFSDINYFN